MAIINIDEIMRCVDLSWQDTMMVTGVAMNQSFEAKVWFWDRPTKRKNGEYVTTPRNINDLKKLQNSQYQISISRSEEEIGWTASHAADVFNGARRLDGTVTPARPWTTYAIAGDANAPIEYQNPSALLNVPSYFTDRLNSYLKTLK